MFYLVVAKTTVEFGGHDITRITSSDPTYTYDPDWNTNMFCKVGIHVDIFAEKALRYMRVTYIVNCSTSLIDVVQI